MLHQDGKNKKFSGDFIGTGHPWLCRWMGAFFSVVIVHFQGRVSSPALLYLAATILAYFLISRQMRRNALLVSRLALADETLESQVKLRTAELEDALNNNKRLQGIIPICANCKSIRNGSGGVGTD
ncbi:MAG: hypothetical protein R2861_03850 [Desulfobacterales bacterium]